MQKGRILMSYREWAGNYRRSAYYLKEQIDSVEAKLKNASCGEAYSLKERLNVLYGMYLDCLATERILLGKARRSDD